MNENKGTYDFNMVIEDIKADNLNDFTKMIKSLETSGKRVKGIYAHVLILDDKSVA